MLPLTNHFLIFTPKEVSIDMEADCDGEVKKLRLSVLARKVDVSGVAIWKIKVVAAGEAIKDKIVQKEFDASTSRRFLLNIGIFDPLYLPEDGVTLNLAPLLSQSRPLGELKEKDICTLETEYQGGLVFDIESHLKREIKEVS
ncbi:hypothetical protein [Estrella lausannensis]|uniref:Uncharacterized protein n=1 Tax=Estrella lausannensis TaxID=483423 RepID=A0A0H5DRU9_9BACT|nr:hypothetical protein [Estrella lausannensis]CRX39347.1 hypothetical protein ELAC_2025 [Estrella lausannensis]